VLVILPATADIHPGTAKQLTTGHNFNAEGRRRSTRPSKRPKDYKPDHRNKKYTEGTIHINLDMEENEPMGDFTIQD
jgi:hypothetical protein